MDDFNRERDVHRRPYMPTPEEYVSSLPGKEYKEAPFKPRRPKKRLWTKVLLALVLLAVAGIIFYVGSIVLNVAKISSKPLDLTGLAADSSGRTNVLVLGVGDPGHSGEQLSDTIMVVSYDNKSKRVAQISVPRDLGVDIPGYGNAKINSANVYGGIPLAEQTVSKTLGIPIHYYVKTNFTGLRKLVDAVGGIDVNVKERLYDPEYPCDNNEALSCGLDIQPGPHHMNGTVALQYSRCRKGTCGNDFGRAARQQEVMNLVREKIVRQDFITNPAKLMPVVYAIRDNVKTDMGSVQMAEFAMGWQQAQKNNPVRLVLSTSPGGYLINSGVNLEPSDGDFTAIQDRVKNIFTVPAEKTDIPNQ